MRTYSIGRSPSNNIILEDSMVSRQHAQLIVSDNGQIIIKDLGSSNGTFVNGNKISETFLKTGDIVKCGNTFLNWQQYIKEKSPIGGYKESTESANQRVYNESNYTSFKPINISNLRHEKEKIYLVIKIIISILFWATAIIGLYFFSIFLYSFIIPIILGVLLIILILWITSLYFKAIVYGHSVKISSTQYSQLFKIVVEYSNRLGIIKSPDVFIFNGDGLINSIAIKFLSRKYVLLSSNLVDIMLSTGKLEELSMIIGHELGHHGAGHTNFWRNLFLRPSSVIPFLSNAYSRACELTADRIGFELNSNLEASQSALCALALGSERLLKSISISSMMNQENEIPGFMGFIQKIFSTHPRTTKRIIEITSYNSRRL
jgi:Zn-dependent protease with chaperone function